MGEFDRDVARATRPRGTSSEADETAVEPRLANSDVAAEAARARRDGGGEPELATTPVQRYEALLGSWLGPKLYNAVKDLITLDKLAGYARSGLDSAMGALGGQLKNIDPSNAGEIDEAVAALRKALGPEAEKFVKAHGGDLADALAEFVDTNPVAVVLIALLAAAGAVAADMKIPELKHTFKVTDELDITLKAKLGTLRNVTVEKIYARVEYDAGDLRASAAASYEPGEDRVGAEVGLDYAVNDELDVYGRGSWLMDVESGGRINPTENTIRGGVRWKPRDNMFLEAYGEYDRRRGAGAGVRFGWKF